MSMERSSKNYFAVFKQQKILGHICFSEQIFYREQSWVPLFGKRSNVVLVSYR